MKYIFWVHSHTAFYTSLATMKYLKLEEEDVIFLSDRGYNNKYFDKPLNDVSHLVNRLSPFTYKTILSLRRIRNEFDYTINKLVNNKNYIAFIPHLTHPIFQLLITNKRCTSYNFVEEGLANYIDHNYTDTFLKFNILKKSLIRFFNLFQRRLVLAHQIFGKYKKLNTTPQYYYLENEYHIKNENMVRLKIERHPIDLQLNDSESVMLILGPTLEYKMSNELNYVSVIKELLNQTITNSNYLYIKYHPYNNRYTKDLINNILSEKEIYYKIIDSSEPLEQVFLNSDNIVVTGIDSSLIFYSAVLNKKNSIVSGWKMLCDLDSTYKEKTSIAPILGKFGSKLKMI